MNTGDEDGAITLAGFVDESAVTVEGRVVDVVRGGHYYGLIAQRTDTESARGRVCRCGAILKLTKGC